MKKRYQHPELVEFGRAEKLTLGASGPQADYIFSNGGLNIDNSNPTCSSNVGSAGCVKIT